MAFGLVLKLSTSLFLQSETCRFVVLGTPEPQSELLQIVDLYRGGSRGELLSRIAAIESDDWKFFRQHVLMVRDAAAPGPRRTAEPDDPCLQAASLLELELAMSLAERSRWEEADSHFEDAWQLSFLIEAPRHRLRFQRDFLLAAGLYNHQLIFVNVAEEAFVRADRFFDNAVRRYPEDAEVLFAAAALLEWSGSLRQGDPSHLKEADELYSRALRFTPDEPEILLRHGVVLEKLGKDDEAAASLHRVVALDARKDLTYRSRMVLGKLAEAADRLPEAIAHYESASKAIPSWQVAYIALGHALHASDSHDRARAELDRAFAIDMEEADEVFGGWWSYELGVALRFEPLFERMRAEVMR